MREPIPANPALDPLAEAVGQAALDFAAAQLDALMFGAWDAFNRAAIRAATLALALVSGAEHELEFYEGLPCR